MTAARSRHYGGHLILHLPERRRGRSLLAGVLASGVLAAFLLGAPPPAEATYSPRGSIASEVDTFIGSGPSGLTNDPTPTWTFSSNYANATFSCALDGGSFAPCSSPYTAPPLTDGLHSLTVRAYAPSRESSDKTPATSSFVVDASPPNTTITAGPSGTTGQMMPTFQFASSEPGSSFQCRLDGGSFSTCSSPLTTAALPPGSHVFEVRAIDQAGNTDPTPAARQFAVDTSVPAPPVDRVPPDTIITARPPDPTDDPTPTFEFTSSEPGSGFECSVDDAAFEPCVSPYTTAPLAPGRHSFRVRAVDAAGNADPSPAVAFEASPDGGFDVVASQSSLPRPVLGTAVNVFPLSGTVLVSLPVRAGQARVGASWRTVAAPVGALERLQAAPIPGRIFVSLPQAKQVPVGSLLDTRKGRVGVVVATNRTGTATQRGEFTGAIFGVHQARRTRAVTELRLRGSTFARCPRGQRGRAARRSTGDAAQARAAQRKRVSKSVIRRLRASAKGRFRTRGRFAAATVRGTNWGTADRCDGTLIHVRDGRVAVRDLRRKRTVVVRAGRVYLVRGPR